MTVSAEISAQAECAFERACALHRERRLEEAEALLRRTVELQPAHASAWHLLGVIALHRNRPESGLELIGRALALSPQVAVFHHEMGNALYALARFNEALACHDTAIRLDPNHADAYFHRGNAQFNLGRLTEALADYDRTIAARTDHGKAHNNRGLVLALLGRREEALASYDRAVRYQRHPAEVYVNRGNLLRDLGDLDAALASYDQAIALRPDLAEPYANRAVVLHSLGRLDAALASCDQAIARDPSHARAYSNRGMVLIDLRDWDAALASYDRAVALQPNFATAYYNRGNLQYELGHPAQALASYEAALVHDPHLVEARFNRSLTLLLAGDFARGWPEYELRWNEQASPVSRSKRQWAQPLWRGEESLTGCRILLHSEQGLGDTIQFCRYAPRVAQLGARVILEVPRPLAALLARLEGVAEIRIQGEPLPAFDYHCPLMSLPLAFRTTLATIPAPIPYLSSDPQRRRHWGEKLGARTKPRVGLVWSGGYRPDQPELKLVNRRRNIALAAFAPLRHEGIEFVSVQKGEPAESELRDLMREGWQGPQIRDYSSEIQDFADTAALLEELDLLISVDTATAHLAGAMGKPVWLLNRFDTCWRWLLERSDTPWYPTMRLYRQRRPEDWSSVIEQVRQDLLRLALPVGAQRLRSS